MTDGVDPAMHLQQPADRQPVVDVVVGEAERSQLLTADDTVLATGELRDRVVRGALTAHIAVKAPRAADSPPLVDPGRHGSGPGGSRLLQGHAARVAGGGRR